MTSSGKPNRLWYPVILIDESLPTGLHSAQAWFDELGPNALHLVDDTELDWMRSYAPGDIVDFKWCEDHGMIEVSIGEDVRSRQALMRVTFSMPSRTCRMAQSSFHQQTPGAQRFYAPMAIMSRIWSS